MGIQVPKNPPKPVPSQVTKGWGGGITTSLKNQDSSGLDDSTPVRAPARVTVKLLPCSPAVVRQMLEEENLDWKLQKPLPCDVQGSSKAKGKIHNRTSGTLGSLKLAAPSPNYVSEGWLLISDREIHLLIKSSQESRPDGSNYSQNSVCYFPYVAYVYSQHT